MIQPANKVLIGCNPEEGRMHGEVLTVGTESVQRQRLLF